MGKEKYSIKGVAHSKMGMERFMKAVFITTAIFGVAAVFAITIYMFINGTPAFAEIGIKDLLFGTIWEPTNKIEPQFGIFYVILTSIVGTFAAVLIGVPIGLFAAIFLAEVAPKPLVKIVQPAVELLAAIPSVIYGLLGLVILNPIMYKWEKILFAGEEGHQFTGGANLLSAIIVLAIMILPTVINVSQSSIQSVQKDLKASSFALGASHIQTIFKVLLPAANSGIISGVVLGIGRAMGEAMAITLVSGSSVNIPLPFNSVRFLTTAIVSEMGYASGLHRQVLFSVGLVLFVFIMAINFLLSKVLKKEERNHA
jgi:phosphate transport system permease protein